MRQKKRQIPSEKPVHELMIAGEKIRLGPGAVPSKPGKSFEEMRRAFQKAAEEGWFAHLLEKLP